MQDPSVRVSFPKLEEMDLFEQTTRQPAREAPPPCAQPPPLVNRRARSGLLAAVTIERLFGLE